MSTHKKPKSCTNRTKCAGLNKTTGQLKKGFKFAKGGAVVKAKNKK
jgi:hypothetical protein